MKAVFAVLKASDVSEDDVGVLENWSSGRFIAGTQFPIQAWKIEGSEVFTSEETADLLSSGYRSCVSIDFHLDRIDQIKKLLTEVVEKWDGFVLIDEVAEKLKPEMLKASMFGNS